MPQSKTKTLTIDETEVNQSTSVNETNLKPSTSSSPLQMHKPVLISSGNEFNNNNTQNINDRLVSETNLKENSLKKSPEVKEDSKLNNFNGNLVNHKKESEKNKVTHLIHLNF